ncbi:ATP-dependent helicase [Vibrio alginolyticus]|uniref:UvrD-helicase domain-containing protein n=1 Tax=Vibrio alginolyticus TaxID=663 RepID=UPI00076DA4E4|nr:UvrD-helicase domain-containing protein [Vibrio alginolyticus]PNP21506.1 ATP-dependent helicase [Vibrio alginolyticus]
MVDRVLLEKEAKIQQLIFDQLDEKKSFYFLAGAGSGKTYALVETLKYSIKKNMRDFDKNGSHLACITYTNAAKDEIIERLYNSNYIDVSTIHSFLWDIIESYQVELIKVHRKNIINIINKLHYELYVCDEFGKKNAFKKIRALNYEETLDLETIVVDRIDDIYNCFRAEGASKFWSELEGVIGSELLSKIQSSRGDVEKIMRNIIKISRLKYCTRMIDIDHPDYSYISYNEKGSREILHKNLIGHDTLIQYSLSMVKEYSLLLRVIIDTFPQIYIDEYQDTHSQVIKIMDMLISYGKDNNMPFFVGLFGDPVQSIYSNNESYNSINNEIDIIHKDINRRSCQNVVDIINKIRGNHQEIHQEPFNSNINGDVSLSYYGKDSVDEIPFIYNEIEQVKTSWGITEDNKLTCMVLRNKTIAQLCGFGNLYDLYSEIYSDKSSYLSYNQINDEALNKDVNKLGIFPLSVLNIAEPLFKINYDSSAPLSDVFSDESLDNHSLDEVATCLDYIRDKDYVSLGDALSDLLVQTFENTSLTSLYSDLSKGWMNNKRDKRDIGSIDDLITYLCSSISSSPSDSLRDNVKALLSMDLKEVFNWIRFVSGIEIDSKVNYITCHGSKGLEFDNVLAVIDDKFGKDLKNKPEKNKFSRLLSSGLHEKHEADLENTRNLLYVICSRAIENLKVILLKEGDGQGAISIE